MPSASEYSSTVLDPAYAGSLLSSGDEDGFWTRPERARYLVCVPMGLAFLLGLAYCTWVRPGLPYDEAAHFDVIRFYGASARLPVVGQDSVAYEAYHPPLYYAVMALPCRVALAVGGERAAFYAIRGLTLIIFVSLVGVVYLIVFDLTHVAAMALIAASFVASNPSLLAIGSSIQNDTLVFLLSAVASWLALRWCWDTDATPPRACFLGLLVGAAILTKLSALPLVIFVVTVMALRSRFRAAVPVVVFAIVMATVTGWWFWRNMSLYHDWTAAKSVETYFGGGPRLSFTSPRDDLAAIRSFVTYYSLPVEYWRNTIRAGVVLRIAVLLSVGLVCTGMVLSIPSNRNSVLRAVDWRRVGAFLSFTVLCIAVWLRVCHVEYRVPARAGMAGLAGVALLVGIAFFHLSLGRTGVTRLWSAGIFIACSILVDVHLLSSASRIPRQPADLHFAQVSEVAANS